MRTAKGMFKWRETEYEEEEEEVGVTWAECKRERTG